MILRKDNLTWVLIVLMLAVVGVTAYFVILPQIQEKTRVRLGDGVFIAEVLRNDEKQTKSMNDSVKLTTDHAELYVYPDTGVWPVWVGGQDSRDFAWISEENKIVYVVEKAPASPAPYRQYMPKARARYILALPGGSLSSKSISLGKNVKFEDTFIETQKKLNAKDDL